MSQLDSELDRLRVRIATLEEQKQKDMEIASDKKSYPLKTLECIINEKRGQIERNRYSKSLPLARFYDQEKVGYLEPILDALKNINDRLDVLEKKN
jgi:hypothetical protein